MYEIQLTFETNTKLLQISHVQDAQYLVNILMRLFNLKQEALGVTDSSGKFYDIEYISKNIQTLHNKKFNIITMDSLKKKNSISFGSRKNVYKMQTQPQEEEYLLSSRFKENDQYGVFCKGIISDLNLFEEKGINHYLYTVLFISEIVNFKLIKFPFYVFYTNKNAVKVYKCGQIAAKLTVFDWISTICMINKYFENSLQIKSTFVEMFKEQKIDILIKNLRRLFAEQIISQFQLKKLESDTIQNFSFYDKKYFDNFKDSKNVYQSLKKQMVKANQELNLYQKILQESLRTKSDQQNAKIPIIVHKSLKISKRTTTAFDMDLKEPIKNSPFQKNDRTN